MTETEKNEILLKTKEWFKKTIIPNHFKNTRKLIKSSEFNINPFLVPYLAVFLDGELTAKSVARALIYPRVLGSSITTSFGSNFQTFISTVLKSYGSLVKGIDIEFIDAVDGRKKYCQVKSGPNTINRDDVESIDRHFKAAKNLGRTNNVPVQQHDLVVGILYGEYNEVSAHYISLENDYNYTLLIGKDFWFHLTGDKDFYEDCIKAIAESVFEENGKELIEKVVAELATSDEIKKIVGE